MMKVTISIAEKALKEVDRIAENERLSRAACLQEAVRLYITSKKSPFSRMRQSGVQRALAVQKRIATKLKGSRYNTTEEIRRDRLAH